MGDNGGYMLLDDLAIVENLASYWKTQTFVDGRFRHRYGYSAFRRRKYVVSFTGNIREEPDPEQRFLAEFNFDEEGSDLKVNIRATERHMSLQTAIPKNSGKHYI